MKKIYMKPKCVCEETTIETTQMLTSSFTGNGSDSDDSEFGYAPENQGQWENMWE